MDAGFALPKAATWEHAYDLCIFRNNIVHAIGITSDGNAEKRLRRLLERAPGITKNSGVYDLTKSFPDYVHQFVGSFLKDLYAELTGLCVRSEQL